MSELLRSFGHDPAKNISPVPAFQKQSACLIWGQVACEKVCVNCLDALQEEHMLVPFKTGYWASKTLGLTQHDNSYILVVNAV